MRSQLYNLIQYRAGLLPSTVYSLIIR